MSAYVSPFQESLLWLINRIAAAKSLQLCPTLCDPIDCSPQGSSIPGILQARTLEWVAIPFSNTWKWKVKVKSLSHVQLFVTPWTIAYQALLSMGFSRQEYWSGVALSFSRGFSSPKDWTLISCISCFGRWILYHWATWKIYIYITTVNIHWVTTHYIY